MCSPSTAPRSKNASERSPATWACPARDSGAVLDWVLELRERIGIPHTLRDIGVGEEHAALLAPMAEKDPSSATNPLPLNAGNLEGLYRRAIAGEL